MASPLRTSVAEYFLDPYVHAQDATVLAFPQPDTTTGQAVFVPEDVALPASDAEVVAAAQKVKAAEHLAYIARNAVSAQHGREPTMPLKHPVQTWRYERQLARLQARKDAVVTHLQTVELALANLQYAPIEYAPAAWLPAESSVHPKAALLRDAATGYLKRWLKAKVATG